MSWISFLKYLPDIYGLIKALQKCIDEAETNRKIQDDLKAIKKAFDEKNIDHINHIFNNKLSDEGEKDQ